MEFFQSYKEAHEALRIPGSFQRGTIGSAETGILSLKLTENPKSLDRVSMDFERIYYVGIGKKSSQGEPAEDQTLDKQQPFFKSLRTQTPFPVLIKLNCSLHWKLHCFFHSQKTISTRLYLLPSSFTARAQLSFCIFKW